MKGVDLVAVAVAVVVVVVVVVVAVVAVAVAVAAVLAVVVIVVAAARGCGGSFWCRVRENKDGYHLKRRQKTARTTDEAKRGSGSLNLHFF